MSRWESYTTVRVTSYRDSTLISKPNNPYLLWLLYKQELRVSSYNKPSHDYSAAHVHVSTSKRRAQSSDRRYALTHSGRLTVNRTYIRLWLSSRLARRSLHASPFGSAGEWSDHSRVRKTAADGNRKWAGTELAMDGYESYYTLNTFVCCTNAQTHCGALEWQQLEHWSFHGGWN